MKAVIHELSAEKVIFYQSQVKEIVRNSNKKIDLRILTNSEERLIESVDLLVVAEGANSCTNQYLLNNANQLLIPPVYGIIAFFKSKKNEHFLNALKIIYFHFLYIINTAFNFITKNSSRISFSILTKTPGQYYLAGAFSKIEENKLKNLSKDINKKQRNYLENLVYHFMCHANFFKLLCFFKGKNHAFFNFGTTYSLERFSIAENAVQRSTNPSGIIEQTCYLVVGDALTTADTLTGSGCNIAIQTSSEFKELLLDLEKPNEIRECLRRYDKKINREVDLLYYQSLKMRLQYRPDTILGEIASIFRD